MSDEVKKYRAYLTRLTKWASFNEANVDGEFNRDHLRSRIIGYGELEGFLGEDWEKKVATNKLFEHSSGPFFSIVDGSEKPKRPEWKGGPRPGEDVAGNALLKIVERVNRMPEPPWKSHRLADQRWDPVSDVCVKAMNYMRSRCVERPLALIQERSLFEATRTDDRAHQTVSLWFVDTRYYLEVYARLRAQAKGNDEMGEQEMGLFKPSSSLAMFNDETGKVEAVEEPFTVEVALCVVRDLLVKRTILKGKAA